MDDQKIHDKLDRIIDNVTEMKLTQIKQQAILEHHVYRCDLLEAGQETLRDETAKAFSEIRDELKPIISFKERVIGALKWTVGLLTAAGVIIGIVEAILH